MYDEMRFLFDVDPNIKNIYNIADGNKIANNANPVQSTQYRKELDNIDDTFKLQEYVINKSGSNNYIKSDVNRLYNTTNSNPYLDLLKDSNDSKTSKALRLKSSDFAYLRDIGVMPINRLMILRRFGEGTVVPVDLSTYNVEPISVVIGWVKKDTNLLSYSFNEVWEKSNKQLHELLAEIIKDSFGVDITSILPIPGWGLGFMFGILNKMGITDFTSTNVPIGNPNLLKEAITRPHETFGLQSSFNFELETTYEQKYIAGIDPTVSTMEILNNLLIMGTSNVETIGKPGSEFIRLLKAANNNPTGASGWMELVGFFVTSFAKALKETMEKVTAEVTTLLKSQDEKPDQTRKEKKSAAEEAKAKEDAGAGNMVRKSEQLSALGNAMNTQIMKSILASTLARYQWPLRGAVSMFTGEPTTPWHLTIGNPYAPLLSMNNVYVSNVTPTYGKDMGHNDMPRTIDAKITMTQGRNLGKQEIFSYFGVTYKRKYTKTNNTTTPTSTKKSSKPFGVTKTDANTKSNSVIKNATNTFK